MLREQERFLSILSDYIYNRQTLLDENINWSELIEIAKKHQLLGIIIEQASGNKIDASAKNILVNHFAQMIKVKTIQEQCLSEVEEYLNSNNIQHCIVKGSVVAKYYYQEHHRSMGDIDIIVNSNDREKVHEYLISMGFENKSRNINHEWVYMRGVCEIELHDRLIYPEVFNKSCEEKFFNNLWDHVKNNELEQNFHFLYLIYHLKKHMTSTGAGFRQFVDLCLMLKNCSELDKPLIIKYLKQTEMTEFAKVIFSFCAYWFNDKSLRFFEGDFKLGPEVMKRQTEIIFRNGVFGGNNEDNRINVSVNNLRFSKFRLISKFRVILMQLFPSYNNLIATSKYDFLRKRPYLLPFAWVYRFCINAKKGNIKSFFEKKVNFASLEQQKKREEDLEQWKII